MTTLREAAQQALDALENPWRAKPEGVANAITALRAALAEPIDPAVYDGWVLREVLFDNGEPVGHREPVQEQQGCDHCNHPLYAAVKCRVCGRVTEPEQEPVAWMWEETATRSSSGIGGVDRKLLFCRPADEPWKRNITPLYTAPPQRKPLTDEEIADIVVEMNGNEPTALFWRDLARAIEAAHGIGSKT